MAGTSELLVLLKQDLIISTNAYDSFLTQQIEGAKLMISREGVTLPPEESEYTAEDRQLVTGYAACLFRQRSEGTNRQKSDAELAIPRWLRWALNNRIFSEKMKTGGGNNGGE